MTQQSTQELLRQARAGDSGAENRLFETVAERILLFIRLRMGAALRQELDSLDILQETFLVAHEKAQDFDAEAPGAYVGWLCRIAENRIRKEVEYRGAAKRQAPGQREAYSQIIDQLRAGVTGPVSALEQSERRALLIERLDAEDETTRKLLLARFFACQSFAEIAQESGHSETTVRRMIGLAAARLGSALRAAEAGE